MKTKLISIMLFFTVTILLLTGGFYLSLRQVESLDIRAEQIIAVNEIEQLAMKGDYEAMSGKAAELQESLRHTQGITTGKNTLFILCGICILFLVAVFGYVYTAILRPFQKMKQFAGEIAGGNFDVPLQYERSNYFGEFTWAFDSMRREITKARFNEKEAIENNKTVIATLSHDIKTPIASIRAYAEGLEAGLDGTPQKRRKYLNVIMKKCDEVSKLTNDLFLHSLSDLDKLKMVPETFELCGFLQTAVEELVVGQKDICFEKPAFTAMVCADKNRLLQVMENLINNARKYAGTQMDVSVVQVKENVEIHVRDYGKGIPDEDMPFIFDKFYRGRNCNGQSGSGLGLYIVKYITEQIGGEICLCNHADGLEVVISLPMVCEKSA